jgi:hypothetical protein
MYRPVGAGLCEKAQVALGAESELKAHFAQLEQLHPNRQALDEILHLCNEPVYLSSYFLRTASEIVTGFPVLLILPDAATNIGGGDEHH